MRRIDEKMIDTKTNIGNRQTYEILIIDGISDTVYKKIALLKNTRENDPEPFIVALGYDTTNGTWSSGWYYSSLESAKNAFYKHTIGI